MTMKPFRIGLDRTDGGSGRVAAMLHSTILPELGGKVHEVIEKVTDEPMFYVNRVIKPGLIGQCGAWVSGGIEWNTGPQGHTVGCMQPVAVEILPEAADGSRSVAIGERDRVHWALKLAFGAEGNSSLIRESSR